MTVHDVSALASSDDTKNASAACGHGHRSQTRELLLSPPPASGAAERCESTAVITCVDDLRALARKHVPPTPACGPEAFAAPTNPLLHASSCCRGSDEHGGPHSVAANDGRTAGGDAGGAGPDRTDPPTARRQRELRLAVHTVDDQHLLDRGCRRSRERCRFSRTLARTRWIAGRSPRCTRGRSPLPLLVIFPHPCQRYVRQSTALNARPRDGFDPDRGNRVFTAPRSWTRSRRIA